MASRRPILIIVSGPPASGKTTLALRLSKDLNLLMLSKDDLKEIIWDNVGYNDAERSKTAWAALAIIKKYTESMLTKGQSIIIESNFDKARSSAYLQDVLDKVDAHSIEVHCIAPAEMLQKRFLHRALHDETRHHGHTDKRDAPNYYEKLYLKSAETLGIADVEMTIDPISEKFSYTALLEQLKNSMSLTKKVKIVVFVPLDSADTVRKAMGDAGAGVIGNYAHCSFSSLGYGRFLPGEGAEPAIGEVGRPEVVEEERIEMICGYSTLEQVLNAMKAAHPYEEVAYDVYELFDV